jgi:hypothetical protein
MDDSYESTFPKYSNLDSITVDLRRKFDQEMLYSLISYRCCLFVNPFCPSPAVFNGDASNYYAKHGPLHLFQYPHLYGFLSLIHAHWINTQKVQNLSIR